MSESLRATDRVANLEARLLDEIAPDLAEGARVLELSRRIEQALAWLKLARQSVEDAEDQRSLARVQNHLLRALDLTREVSR